MARTCTSSEGDRSPVVVVDDEELFLYACRLTLRNAGIEAVHTIGDSRELFPFLAGSDASVVVLDLCMPHLSGMELLPAIVEGYPQIPVVVISGASHADIAARCLKAGAFDYLVKPVTPCCFVTGVKRAIRKRDQDPDGTKVLEPPPPPFEDEASSARGIVTGNRTMKEILRYLGAIAGSGEPVLITGETGVGKELFAREIHEGSGRKGAFVAVNVAGLDDMIFSDTLFGHTKGAYTGADGKRTGLLAHASGGTLFLDEIGDLVERSQVKLLRLLQEKEYYPLGADRAERSDCRILCATNRDLPKLVSAGRFRQDLYYRLRSHHIHVPPLRDRIDDLPLLVDFCLEEAARLLGKRKPTAPPELGKILGTYHFPGNVRELRALICDAVARHRSGVLSIESIREALAERRQLAEPPENGGTPPDPDGIDAPFELINRFPTEKEAGDYLLSEALRRSGYNQAIAAHLLGISREALCKRLSRKRKLSNDSQPGRKAG